MQENVPEAENADMEYKEQELEDVRVCDTCGDEGYEEKLAPCCQCENGAEHIYCMPSNPKEVPRDWVCETCKQKEKESTANLSRKSEEEKAKIVAEEKLKEGIPTSERTSDEGEEKEKERALTLPAPRQVKPLHSPPRSSAAIKRTTSAINTLRAPKAPLPTSNSSNSANTKPGPPPRVLNAEGTYLQLQKPDAPVNRIALEISKAKEALQSRSFQERQRASAENAPPQSVADVKQEISFIKPNQEDPQVNHFLQEKATVPLSSLELRDVKKQNSSSANSNQAKDVEIKNEKPRMATPDVGANGALPRTCHKCNEVGHLPQFCPNGAVKKLLGRILQTSTQQASEHQASSEPHLLQLPSPTDTTAMAAAACVQAPEASIQLGTVSPSTSIQDSMDPQLPVASVQAMTCLPAPDPTHTVEAPLPSLELPGTGEPGVAFPAATIRQMVVHPVQVPGTPAQVPLTPPGFTPLAQPSPNALWRGVLRIGKETFLDGMKAHASNKADPKVLEASKLLEDTLNLEELPRAKAWPKRFENTPPSDNDIALYFFPMNDERLTRQYKELLERMTSMDLVLKTKVDEVELLIYSSTVFFDYGLQYFGVNKKPYLWGVFRKPPAVKHMPMVEAQEISNKDVVPGNALAVAPGTDADTKENAGKEPGTETNKKENAGKEAQLSAEEMDVPPQGLPEKDYPPGYAPQGLAEKDYPPGYAPQGFTKKDYPPGYGPRNVSEKEASAKENLREKKQDSLKPDHIERPRGESRRESYRDHRRESERYHRSPRDKDRERRNRRLLRSSSRRSRSPSVSPRRERYRHRYRYSRSWSRSPDRSPRVRSRRSWSRSPSWCRSRSHSYSRSPVRRREKNRSRSPTRSASPRRYSTRYQGSPFESCKSPEVNPVYHNFLDLERTSEQECTAAVAEPPRRGGFDLQADDLTLAVPQYRKAGDSWVKVEQIGKEDVNFALSSLCSSSSFINSNTQANAS